VYWRPISRKKINFRRSRARSRSQDHVEVDEFVISIERCSLSWCLRFWPRLLRWSSNQRARRVCVGSIGAHRSPPWRVSPSLPAKLPGPAPCRL
jgi:hypothetical protein